MSDLFSTDMELWRVRARCDWLEEFSIDVFEFYLETCDIVEAASHAAKEISYDYTIISIERVL